MTKAWSENKSTILAHYQTGKLPLREVIEIMERRHGFKASPRAFRQQFRNWGIKKYNRKKKTHLRSSPTSNTQTTSPNTPRPVHAHTAQRLDSLQTGLISPLPYSSPSSASSTSYVDNNLTSPALMLAPHTPQAHYTSPGVLHSVSRGGKLSKNVMEEGKMQKISRQGSPSSFLYPTTDSTMAVRAPAWQPAYRNAYPQPPAMDYHMAFRKTSYGSYGTQAALDMGSQNVDTSSSGSHHHHSPHNGAAEYGSEYQYQDRPPYGGVHAQSGTKQPSWGISDIASGASMAYEPRYHLPSPPHAQSQSRLSPSAAKTVEEHANSARSSPLSPSSLPDATYQSSLHRGHSGSVYSGDTLNIGIEYGRTPETIFTTSPGVSDGVSLPALTSTSPSPSVITAHSQHSLYSGYPPY